MKGLRYCNAFVVLAVWLSLTMPEARGEDTATSPAAPAASPGVSATLVLKDSSKEVILVGRKGTKVLYCFSDSSRSVLAIENSEIRRARMKLEYDVEAFGKATASQDWAAAGSLLAKTVWPALPFLDLKANNAAPLALRTGVLLMRAGSMKSGGGFSAEQRQLAQKEYRTALTILGTLSKAGWYDRADEAALRATICLLMLDRADEAKKTLEATASPQPTDDSYGLYWLAQAYAASAGDESLAAMEDVSQSLGFETHDIDTFPDALLLSARCYEKAEDWHRARDVYYELGMLFTKTHWGEIATARLKYIMDQGLTEKAEEARIRNVFFGVEEDMNAKAKEFLSGGKDKGKDKKADDKPGKTEAGAKPDQKTAAQAAAPAAQDKSKGQTSQQNTTKDGDGKEKEKQ